MRPILMAILLSVTSVSIAGEGVYEPKLGTFIPFDGTLLEREAGTARLRAIDFSPDETRLIAGYADGKVVLFDIASKREQAKLDCGPGSIVGLAMASAESLVVGTRDESGGKSTSNLQVWDLAAPRITKAIKFNGFLRRVVMDQHAKYLALCTDDAMQVLACPSLEAVATIKAAGARALFARDGAELVVFGSGFPFTRVYRAPNFERVAQFRSPLFNVTSTSVSRQSTFIGIGGYHGTKPGIAADFADLWIWDYSQWLERQPPRIKVSFGEEPRTQVAWRMTKPQLLTLTWFETSPLLQTRCSFSALGLTASRCGQQRTDRCLPKCRDSSVRWLPFHPREPGVRRIARASCICNERRSSQRSGRLDPTAMSKKMGDVLPESESGMKLPARSIGVYARLHASRPRLVTSSRGEDLPT